MKNSIREVANIIQAVSLAETAEQQVVLIVDSIAESMAIEVCSLYLENQNQDMELFASQGLTAPTERNLILPKGKGIVGLVAATRHPINIADAEEHPAYYYIAATEEERFHGFCAVPLVYMGKVIGVLVVQSSKKREFTQDEESFLVTLSAQLALLINKKQNIGNSGASKVLTGIKGTPGIGIGQCYRIINDDLDSIADQQSDDISQSLKEWHELVDSVKQQVIREKQALTSQLGETVGKIFDVYISILADKTYMECVEQQIKTGNWIPGAVRQATLYFREVFLKMEDEYLKTRYEDIYMLGNKLIACWHGGHKDTETVETDIILTGKQITVSDIASVPASHLKGVISTSGSTLSHVAVLANAMGIPAVFGVAGMQQLGLKDLVIVNGENAEVIINPNRTILSEYRSLVNENQQIEKELEQYNTEPAVTLDGYMINLFTNTGLLADVTPGLKKGAQGVGLYRTEIPFMMQDSFPTEDVQENVYRSVLQAYAGKPVYMRILDIGGDKQLPYFQIRNETNPALGWRGIRFALDNSQLLMTQIRAMLKASKETHNLHILLPMITSCTEVDKFLELLEDASSQLREEGFNIKTPQVGIMIEVPGAISQIAFWAGKIDFLSIGSNDLSQYLLAIDRNNARVAAQYDHVHPAVLHEIKRIIQHAKITDLPVSLCGEMATDPVAVTILLGMGLRTLSMSAVKLPFIKWFIRNLKLSDAVRITNQALLLDNPEKIRLHVMTELNDLGLADMIRKVRNIS